MDKTVAEIKDYQEEISELADEYIESFKNGDNAAILENILDQMMDCVNGVGGLVKAYNKQKGRKK